MSYHCDRCGLYYRMWSAFDQHLNNHNICDDCDEDFPSWVGLREHWIQSPRHSYCRKCDEHFYDDGELRDHYDAAHFWCPPCKKIFKNKLGLTEHYRQSDVHHYCDSCNHLFKSASNLRAHLNSSTHQPRNVKCRARGCTATFVSVSAMLLHLESGNCVSGIDRSYINQRVREFDRDNLITDPSRMIAGPDSQFNSRLYATESAWNGRAYECYLCHTTYRTLAALNQHLGSPRHQDRIYVCPLNTCRTNFSALSALCQHIESGRCGVDKFRVVRDTMNSVVSGMNRLTF